MLRSRARGAALVATLLVMGGSRAEAQASTLAVAGALALPSPATVADYEAGYICAGTLGVTVTITTPRPNNVRTDVVYVSTNGPITGGALNKLADFQWTTNPAGCAATTGWNSLTQAKAQVAQGTGSGNNTVIVNQAIHFRLVLAWATDAGNTTLTMPSVLVSLN
jgi:ornithine carbamoyltransferase